MNRTLVLSLSLIFAVNACTVTSTQAIGWKKVKKYSIVAIGSLTAAAIVFYGLKKLAHYRAQVSPFDLPHESMNSPFATF